MVRKLLNCDIICEGIYRKVQDVSMAHQTKKPFNPVLIPVISTPHFLLGGLLAALNWHRLGFPGKARATLKWCLIGTVAIVVIIFFIPPGLLRKMWSIGVGINLGTGMALRTLQLPDYNKAVAKPEVR